MKQVGFIYIPRKNSQLRAIFYRKKSLKDFNFSSVDDFLNWYNTQDPICSVCGVHEALLQELVLGGKLKSKRFPLNGLISKGRARGVWLEIDRDNSDLGYSKGNCSLICYFCNNDKSDVFTKSEYLDFSTNRYNYLKGLLEK